MSSIVDFLKSQNKDSSYAARQKLASQYGIANYRGTAAQNLRLLDILKSGTDKNTSDQSTTTSTKVTTKKPKYSDKQLELVKSTLKLTRTPTEAEVDKLFKLKDKIGEKLTAENVREYYKNQKATKEDISLVDTTSGTTEPGTPDPFSEYLSGYIGALGETYDKATAIKLQEFQTAQEDLDTSMKYYRQDFEKITSRKTQDYYKGIALQNKEFSKSLDYVSNYATKTIGALQGFGKNRIIEATGDKMESQARYRLDFSRSMEDLATQKSREEARYKLSTERLAKGKEQYEAARETEKKVGLIEATGDIKTYYDQLVTGRTLAEDQAAGTRRDIIGGGTGVEKILNY